LSRNFFRVAQKFFLTFGVFFSIIHTYRKEKISRKSKKVLDLLLISAYNYYSEVEKPIQETENLMLEYAIFVFCVIGCGLTCHALGKQEGIETTIEHLVDNGLLELDEEK